MELTSGPGFPACPPPSCQPCENHHHIWIQMRKLRPGEVRSQAPGLTAAPPPARGEGPRRADARGGAVITRLTVQCPASRCTGNTTLAGGGDERGSGWAGQDPSRRGVSVRDLLPSSNQLVLTGQGRDSSGQAVSRAGWEGVFEMSRADSQDTKSLEALRGIIDSSLGGRVFIPFPRVKPP